MKHKIQYLKRGDLQFPKNLEALEDCPDIICVIGDIGILNDFSLSIVGSRKCSEFGRIFALDIAKRLNKKDIIIVSGLALGIDSAAHRGCIQNKGKTIAVLGGGFNNIYPKENDGLIDEIIENGGAIISEYMPDTQPLKRNFKARNRIIAAISNGTILIEAKEKSGSLTTIRYAKELDKKIFVAPGGLNDELYEGSNRILSEGAFCVRCVDDVLFQYEEFEQCVDKNTRDNKEEKIINGILPEFREIYKKIKYRPTSLETICLNISEPVSVILSKLTMLEMQGYIIELQGKKFIRAKL